MLFFVSIDLESHFYLLFVLIVKLLYFFFLNLTNPLSICRVAKHVYIQAMPAFLVRRENPDGTFTGKEYHLQKVVEEIFRNDQVTINKQEILLLDDDMTNVSAASSYGHHSMQVQVQDRVIDYDTLDSFETMLRIAG